MCWPGQTVLFFGTPLRRSTPPVPCAEPGVPLVQPGDEPVVAEGVDEGEVGAVPLQPRPQQGVHRPASPRLVDARLSFLLRGVLANIQIGAPDDITGSPLTETPEPGTVTLMASGLIGLAAVRRRLRSK